MPTYTLPAITIDPPPLTVDPPPITITPPGFDAQPPSFTVTPPAVSVGGHSYTPPSITIQPPAVHVTPPSLRIDPPPVTIDPPPFSITPPPVTIDRPPPLVFDPPPLTVTPPPIAVQPPMITVTPPTIAVPSTTLTITPPGFRVGFVTVHPGAMTVTVPGFAVTPTAITVTPPSITVTPPAITVDPPPIMIRAALGAVAATAYDAFDREMRSFMRRHGIGAGVLAVMNNGRMVLERGYGFMALNPFRRVRGSTPMRFASVVKPITRAAIRELVAAGQLNLTDLVFPRLGIAPLNLPGHHRDPRLDTITVQHLLDHRGGWDRDVGPVFDPMFQTPIISAATHHAPAGAKDIIQFMVGQPLQHDPGTVEVYSNFGYCVLGRVIEQVTGTSYVDHVRARILAPLGVTSIELGRSLPRDRNHAEPAYLCREPPIPNVVEPWRPPGPAADGGFYLEAMDSHGGLIGTAGDLVRFAQTFDFDGIRYSGGPSQLRHDGRLPGTLSTLRWRSDGVLFAAIVNGSPAGGIDELAAALDRVVDGTVDWP